jgi:hypothetical protein
MSIRTKRLTMTFAHPFSLKGVDRRLAAGRYEVVTDDELIGEHMFPVYCRVSTLIFIPVAADHPTAIEMVNVDAADLAAAHARDQSTIAAVAAGHSAP